MQQPDSEMCFGYLDQDGTEVLTEVAGDEISKVLDAFAGFLRDSGFVWVKSITAHCDGIDWHSSGQKALTR
jgi:hypothetical protein